MFDEYKNAVTKGNHCNTSIIRIMAKLMTLSDFDER